MTVQVATCSAAQLFSDCLLADDASPTDGAVSADGRLVRGELTTPEYQRPYRSLKLKAIFDLHSEAGGYWREEEIAKHQRGMLEVLRKHHSR
tara:strand:+ start:2488 stop:2763 length:276 start_codon:yes stop_codon:yes gene_type:complete